MEIDTIASVYGINRIGVLGSSSDPVMGGQTFSDPEGTAITDAADLRGKMFVKADGWHQISTCSDPNVIYRVNGTVAEAIGLIDRSAAYSLIGEFYNSGGIDYEVASISDNAFRESSLTGIGFLSLVAPISVGDGWITDTPSGITGHARNGSDFPVSGDSFHGLPMGENLALIPAGVKNLVYDGSEKTGVIPGTGCTVSGNTGVGAGTYEATAILTAGYIWSDGTMVDKSISWKIAKAPLSIIADDKNTTYSSEPPHYTVSYSGFVNGETDEVVNEGTATASYSRWDPVGFYPITAAGYTADNYEIIYFAGWLNVTEHSIDIPAVMTDMIYSGSEQTGVVPGTGYTVSGNTGVGAGTYEATATLTAGYIWSDGTMGNMTIFWNIAKAAYDMTGIAWSAASFVYDGSEKAVTISGLPAGVTVSAYTGNTGTDAGTYHANATFAYDSANYNEPSVADHEWIIALGTQTVSSEGYTGTYDGSAHGITVTQTGGTVTYGTVPGTYDLTEPPVYTNAGDYTVYFKVVKANYEDYTGSATVKINKAILTATYGGETVTYGNVPVLSVNVTGFVNGETAETAAGYAAPTTINTNVNAGTYILNPSGGAADNYDFSYVAGDLIIQPKTVSVTPDALSKVYGGVDPVFTYTLSETVAVTGALSREPGEDVGTYAMTLGDLSAGGNYTLSLVPTNFAITKVPLTIKADDKAMAFGGAEPEYTVTYTGFVNGETQTALTGTLSVTSGYDSGVYAPTAVITASGLTSANYAITYETGVLTVSKIQVDAPTAVTGLAYSGTQQTGVVAAAAGYTLTGNTGTDAGDYTATAALADGYIWSDASTAAKTIPWNIIPKAVNLTVDQIDDQTYTGSVIEPEVLIRDGSSPLVMGTDYTISYSDNVNAGIATITATGMGNYSGSSGSGTFTVLRKTVDVSPLIWDYASSFVYDGTTKSVSLTYVPEGLTAQYTDSSKMDAGDFTASVILVPDGNHGISGTVEDLEWSIDPKVITVTPDALSKVYGGADPVLSYALSEPVSVTGALGRDSGESVGTYAITIGTLSAGGNHEIIMVDPAVAFEILADCPGAPSIVGVEPGNGQVGLIWNAPGTDGGVPITGYEVWYKAGQTGDWIRYCTTTVEDGTVTGLINGQVCAFRLAAVNSAGAGPASAEITAIPHTIPGTPVVSATAGNCCVGLEWFVEDNGGSDIMEYVIYQGTEEVARTSDVLHTVAGLVNGAEYAFQVAAVNAAGEGPKSAEMIITPLSDRYDPTEALQALVADAVFLMSLIAIHMLRRRE